MEPNYLVLLGIVIVIIEFALKLDAILIIIVSAVATALVGGIIPKGNVTIGIIVFGVGMMLFTMIMGNAFAAITVMTVGIGAPFVLAYGGQLQHRARCDARHEGPHGRDQEAGAAGDGDVLLPAGAQILCSHVYDTVLVDVECYFDLRYPSRSGCDAVQTEGAQLLVVLC